MFGRRRGFTLVELLVTMGIIGLLVAILIPAVQQARQAALRANCASNLRQLGVALHGYLDVHQALPPAMVSDTEHLTSAQHSGFTQLLPFLEQKQLFSIYRQEKPWFDAVNYAAVGEMVPVLYCPSNRSGGGIGLEKIAETWSCPLPPFAAGTDYVFCKGANAALTAEPEKLPAAFRGAFDTNSRVALKQIVDGTSNTIAMGEAAGGNNSYLVRDLQNPAQGVVDVESGGNVYIEQSWGAGCVTNSAYPYYGSVFAVTAQQGGANDPRYEPMNPSNRLVAPTIEGDDDEQNSGGQDWVSGFRSMHATGCNFLYCDGGVHFLSRDIDLPTYLRLSTIAGRDTPGEDPANR